MTQLSLPECNYNPEPYNGPTREETWAKRKQYCNPAVFTLYKEPLMLVDGHMQYVFDEQGTRYLDFFAGIVTVSCGHCHPKIVARTEAQLRNLQHTSTVYLNPGLPLLAEKLASKLPGELEVTYFVNSGSEANDLAMLMARLYSGNFEMLALRNAYHGGVSSVMGLTAHHTWKYPVPHVGVQRVACPDPYRSAYSGTAEEVAHACAEDIRSVIRHSTPGKVAGFIAEPIQGVGGAVAYGGNYFGEAYKIVREHGGLCIADEVQTGFGRTGERYWGFENYDVVPDIVTMAKGLGNGAPIAAVSTTREIAETLAQRIHINTFGGNPVSMAQGLATLDVIDEEDLQNNAHEMGQLLQSGLLELMEKYPLIGEVRGIGLMLGVELVRDRSTKEPASAETAEFLELCRENQLLLGKGGLFGNVLRIKPPLCITCADVEYALHVMDQSFAALSCGAGRST